MRKENKEFALEVFTMVWRQQPDYHLAVMGAAMAATECAWGRAKWLYRTNNLFAIKPSSPSQCFIVLGTGDKMRKFKTREASVKAWLYLMNGSRHYEKARRNKKDRDRASFYRFVEEITEVFDPKNLQYGLTVKQIMVQIEGQDFGSPKADSVGRVYDNPQEDGGKTDE